MKTKSITKVTLLSIVVMSAITAVTLNSCQKESIKPKVVNSLTKSQGASSFASKSGMIMRELNNFMFATKKNQKGLIPGGADSNSCVIITIDTISKPNTIVCDYGSSCIGNDHNVRSGKVTISYANQDIRLANNVISVTFQSYTFNGTSFDGGISLTNTGPNGAGHDVLVESGAVVSKAPGEISADTVSESLQYEWIANESSSPAADWQFSITGEMNSSYKAGQSDSTVITTPLIKNAKSTTNCNYTIQGTLYTVTTTPQGLQYRYEDFGNPGGCSGQEAVTVNGVTDIQNQ